MKSRNHTLICVSNSQGVILINRFSLDYAFRLSCRLNLFLEAEALPSLSLSP